MDVRLDDGANAVLAAALEQSATGQFVAGAAGGWEVVNPPLTELTGLAGTEVLSDGWIAAVHSDDRAEVVAAWWRAVQLHTPFDRQFRCRRADGSEVSVRAHAEPVVGQSGAVVAWVGSIAATESDRTVLDRSEPFLRAALAHSSDLVVVVDRAGTLTYVSEAAGRILGLVPTEWLGRSVFDLIHPDDVGAASESLVTGVGTGSGVKEPLELRIRHSDGHWCVVEAVGNNLLADPLVAGILINVRDVSERRLAKQQELRARGRFEQAFERSPIGMALTTLDGHFVRVNHAMCDLLGRAPTRLLSDSVLEVTHPDDVEVTIRSAVELLEGNSPSYSLEKRFLTGDGQTVWTRATVTLLRGDDEEPVHFLMQIENIEERRVLIEQLRHSALVDPLTGLANRTGLDEYLGTMSPAQPIAVLALDLDTFKHTNDTAGHAAGDQVLRVVADRIRSAIRPTDQAARVGGDEYVVVCSAPGSSEWVRSLADRLVATIHEPISYNGTLHTVGASVGAALGVARSAGMLLDRADNASYHAKRSGGNSARVHGELDPICG